MRALIFLAALTLAAPVAADDGRWTLAVSRIVQGGDANESDMMAIGSLRTGPVLPLGLWPDYALGVGESGEAFLSVGLGRSFDIGGAALSVRTGPALFRSNVAGADAGERVQFYSAIGLSAPVGPVDLGFSIGHISNANIDPASADYDLVGLTVGMRF